MIHENIFYSRFTKNLSPDKIKVSTLKGEGDLQNLELDETILMDILDLPTWLKLTKAVVNKLSIKVCVIDFKKNGIASINSFILLHIFITKHFSAFTNFKSRFYECIRFYFDIKSTILNS